MKFWVYVFGFVTCALFAVWAYSIAAKTRIANIELIEMQVKIAKEHEKIEVLQTEWAYLNRPERLRHLVMLNNDKLGLQEIVAENYGEAEIVPYSLNSEPSFPKVAQSDLQQILSEVEASGSVEQ